MLVTLTEVVTQVRDYRAAVVLDGVGVRFGFEQAELFALPSVRILHGEDEEIADDFNRVGGQSHRVIDDDATK